MVRTVGPMNDTLDNAPSTTPAEPTELPLAWDELHAAATATGDGLYLATVDPAGRPHVAYVSVGWADERLWMSSFASSRKARNLAANPIASLTCPPSPEVNLLIRAEARLVHDLDETRDLWARGVLPYDPSAFFSGPEDPETQFIELLPTVASIGTLWPSPPRRWRRS